jgi:hypothetical protein
MQFKSLKQPSSLRSELQTDTFAFGFVETHPTLLKALLEVQTSQTKYPSGIEAVFKDDRMGCLSLWLIGTTQSSKKLDNKCNAPYTATPNADKNAFKFDIPYATWKYNGFHVSLLGLYRLPSTGQPPSELQQTVVDNTDQWKHDRDLDTMRHCPKLHYLPLWVGLLARDLARWLLWRMGACSPHRSKATGIRPVACSPHAEEEA